MSLAGVPAGGFRTVGQLVGTNSLSFHRDDNARDAAVELISTHMSGAPVVDDAGALIGFISEVDLLQAQEVITDLDRLTVGELMTRNAVAISPSTTVTDAIRIMKENHWLNLPVQENGVVKYSVTRHDLLRASTGMGLGPDA